MKKLSSMMMIALAALAFQACNNSAKDSKETADSVNEVKDTTTTGATGIAVDEGDAKFTTTAASDGMAEIALAKLAQEKSTNTDVKSFAAMMITDHEKAAAELSAIAETKNITLPSAPTEEQQKMQADLTAKKGADFDKAYIDGMVKAHENAVSLFDDASKNCKDADLKAFATKTLPTLKAHETHVKSVQKKLK
ncbi:DUF4142 domain-containing protein [Mucilaginibacter gynuensis]|uniref:DUF4142 domain-containing protein n=1 Tax=Mucilaginibacter gynuensis TaxID=1302236 RepID=A0ABP8GUB0_9SPHI